MKEMLHEIHNAKQMYNVEGSVYSTRPVFLHTAGIAYLTLNGERFNTQGTGNNGEAVQSTTKKVLCPMTVHQYSASKNEVL